MSVVLLAEAFRGHLAGLPKRTHARKDHRPGETRSPRCVGRTRKAGHSKHTPGGTCQPHSRRPPGWTWAAAAGRPGRRKSDCAPASLRRCSAGHGGTRAAGAPPGSAATSSAHRGGVRVRVSEAERERANTRTHATPSHLHQHDRYRRFRSGSGGTPSLRPGQEVRELVTGGHVI